MRGEIAVPCKTAKLLTGPAEFNSPWQQAYEVAVAFRVGTGASARARVRSHQCLPDLVAMNEGMLSRAGGIRQPNSGCLDLVQDFGEAVPFLTTSAGIDRSPEFQAVASALILPLSIRPVLSA